MLRFVDSCQHLDSGHINTKWLSHNGYMWYDPAVAGHTSPRGTPVIGGVNFTANVTMLGSFSKFVVGVRAYFAASPLGTNALISIFNNGPAMIGMGDGRIAILTNYGGTTTPSTSWSMHADEWNYYELVVVMSGNSVTYMEGWANGVMVCSWTGSVDLSSIVHTQLVSVGGNGGGDSTYICDFYVLDGIASIDSANPNNAPLGDVEIDSLFTIADGNYGDFTITGASTRWQDVTDQPTVNYTSSCPDDDTTGNNSVVVGNKDSFVMTKTNWTGIIHGAQVNILARKDSVGTRAIIPIRRQSGSDYIPTGADQYLSNNTSYRDYMLCYDVNPKTNLAFTPDDLDQTGSEWGYKIDS